MERRVLLAIFLSFLVLYAHQALLVRTPPASTSTASPNASPVGTNASDPASATPKETPSSAEPEGNPPSTPVVGDTSEHDVRVETADVVATFTNRGARLKSWRLKKFK